MTFEDRMFAGYHCALCYHMAKQREDEERAKEAQAIEEFKAQDV